MDIHMCVKYPDSPYDTCKITPVDIFYLSASRNLVQGRLSSLVSQRHLVLELTVATVLLLCVPLHAHRQPGFKKYIMSYFLSWGDWFSNLRNTGSYFCTAPDMMGKDQAANRLAYQ